MSDKLKIYDMFLLYVGTGDIWVKERINFPCRWNMGKGWTNQGIYGRNTDKTTIKGYG
jgi:hypothetical protein